MVKLDYDKYNLTEQKIAVDPKKGRNSSSQNLKRWLAVEILYKIATSSDKLAINQPFDITTALSEANGLPFDPDVEKLEILVEGPDGEEKIIPTLQGGDFVANFTPKSSGSIKVSLKYDGEPIGEEKLNVNDLGIVKWLHSGTYW